MAKKKKTQEPQRDIGQEIWGLVFIALGLLVVISLLARGLGRPEVLGPIFGSMLSRGLVLLVGGPAAVLIPLGIVGLGWRQLKGHSPTVRGMVVWTVLVMEVSTLLAIHNIRIVERGSFGFESNFLGNGVTYLLHFLFGPHPLGPYFLFVVAFIISVLVAFRINVRTLYAAVSASLRAAVVWLRDVLTPVFSRPEPATVPAAGTPTGKAPAATEKQVREEEEARKRLEEELAAFRARKKDPITISSEETPSGITIKPAPEPEPEPEEEPKPLADIDEGAFQPSTTPKKPSKPYKVPMPRVLSEPPPESSVVDRDMLEGNSQTLEKTLLNFGVEGRVVNVSPGPVINRYEIELAPGIKVSKVVNLQDDISLAVSGQKIRIQAPIPGKSAVGIELPNPQREIVHFKHVLMSDAFQKTKAKLPVIIGKSISGAPFVTDINRMPHLLIAGQTGSGKSVCINCLICSLLMTKSPDELRLIMVDPKKVELAAYEGIPHLMSKVVTESKEAVKALQWGVAEMERRYRLLAKVGAREIGSFNSRIKSGKVPEDALDENDNKPLPFIVILVDELADLMMTASRDVETLIMRIAQLARAVGIHLIVATQRPSVDIITGPIKANLTSRIAFRTIQSTDSRTILGHIGAEKLLGMGDLLFLRNGAPDIERFHGAFISEEDVENLVSTIREQYVEVEKIDSFEVATASAGGGAGGAVAADDRDELFEDAARTVVGLGQGSTSLLQRRMKIGYARAGRLMDELEQAGIVGAQEGSKMREVLVQPDEIDHLLTNLRGV